MKLFGMGKSRSFRAVWALEESELDYEYVAVTFGKDGKNGTSSQDYRDLNSQGKVPTLVDDDIVITEGAAILNYVAAKSLVTSLMPTDLKPRARYDEICYFILSDFEQALWTHGKHRFALPEAQRVPEIKATAIWEFAKSSKALRQLFDGNRFVVGDSFTMADILLAHTLNWAINAKFDVADEFIAYKNRMYQRPGCISALARVEQPK